MSKLIQSAYASINSQKYKKAITILESPELRFSDVHLIQ